MFNTVLADISMYCVVTEGAMASSYERKYMSFKLLQSFLPTLTASEVGVVFSSVFVEQMTQQCKHEGKSLHSAVKELVSWFVSVNGVN